MNDIDFVGKIEKDFKLLKSQYKKMSTENLENLHANFMRTKNFNRLTNLCKAPLKENLNNVRVLSSTFSH